MSGSAAPDTYFRQTRTLLFSYLACLPLLLLYELLILVSQPSADQIVRISVDAWFKTFFTTFGLNALSATLFVAAAAGVAILWKDRRQIRSLKVRFFFWLLLEALLYAILLALLISALLQSLLMVQAGSPIMEMPRLQLIALSLGAGLYEELFFRVILVSLLIYLFDRLFRRRWLTVSAAVVTAAICFSAVHYTGPFGDPFTVGSFLFRFLFGLALNLIYFSRGFGMAAWTHAIYDLLVISFTSAPP